MEQPITRLMLHQKMVELSRHESIEARKSHVLEYLKEHFRTNGNEEATKVLIKFVRENFFAPYTRKWKSVHSNNAFFLEKYGDWLEQVIVFPDMLQTCLSVPQGYNPGPSSGGRPSKQFEDSSDVIKRRKTSELRKRKTVELTYATSMNLRKEGNVAASSLLVEATTSTPTRAKRILTKWKSPDQEQRPYSPEEALALIIKLNLSRDHYLTLRSSAKSHGHDLYPSYHKVLEAKKKLYPEGIIIEEKKCEVPLQSLLFKTCDTIIRCISLTGSEDRRPLKLMCKWGFDGSSGYHAYKHLTSSTQQDVPKAEQSVFVTSIVPLRLVEENSGKILWKNPKPASKQFCRPIRLQWLHETTEVSRTEEAYINKQIEELLPFDSQLGPINFSLSLTMVDGKVCSALTETSSMTCYICKAKISQMNEIKSLREKEIKPETFRFGLSVLHAYIRFFEFLLHVSYRLEIKVWKIPKNQKASVEARKQKIQKEFHQKMGLLVDIPRTGAGTTNDGNTARRFFNDPSLSSQITGIDEDLIRRFSTILKAINSGYDIQVDNFEAYCLTAAEKFISLYGWYYMPPSVHKVLIHGPLIIREAILPIGELSEEAQESKNKDVRYFREHHTRKVDSLKISEDLFHRLILSSDPYLSSLGLKEERKRDINDADLRSLLIINTEDNKENLSGNIDSADEESSEDEI